MRKYRLRPRGLHLSVLMPMPFRKDFRPSILLHPLSGGSRGPGTSSPCPHLPEPGGGCRVGHTSVKAAVETSDEPWVQE